MPFVIIMRHGWLLRWWKRRPAENNAIFDLFAVLRLRFFETDPEIELITAPEMETIRAGQTIADYYGTDEHPIKLAVSVAPCLKEIGRLPIHEGLTVKLLDPRASKIMMTHRRRIRPLIDAIVAKQGKPIRWIRPTRPSTPRRDQALVINAQTLEAEICRPRDLAEIMRSR